MIFRLGLKAFKKPFKTLRFLRFFVFRPHTYILATMHQSGTHWLQNILAHILFPEGFDTVREVIPKIDQSCLYEKDHARIKIAHTHTKWNIFFKGKKAIILIRDIRDSIVSQYEKYIKVNNKNISFSEFLRKEKEDVVAGHTPISSRVEFLNSWADKKNNLVISYEDLKTNPQKELHKICEFLNIDVTEDTILGALEYSSLEKMKKENEASVNKGVVGRYEEYFSEEDKVYLQEYLRKNLKDSYGYDYTGW